MEQQTKLEAQADRLLADLKDVAAAEGLANLESGHVIPRWLTARIQLHVDKITGTSYIKDHTGYIKTLAALEEDRFLLRKYQAAINPGVKEKLQRRLKETNESIEDEREQS